MGRPTRADIDLGALRDNYALACRLSGNGRCMPIVKANAYGHGIVSVARALEPAAPAFGVACIEEALVLREAGISIPILLLEGFFSEEELELACEHGFWLMVQDDWQLAILEAARPRKPLNIWLKLDTGMHRLGFDPVGAAGLYRRVSELPHVAPGVVLATHFASADDLDKDFTRQQLALFDQYTAGLDAPRSLANSPALLGWPAARADWNRPGLMLYGCSPFQHPHPSTEALKPVMRLRSEVMALREVPAGDTVGYANAWQATRPSRIVTIPVGYGDGYPRHARNGTPVLVNGYRAPLVGRVSMDMITVDVTDLGPVGVGDEVVLWGDALGASEIADHAETIGYEIITRIHNRVPRVTVG
jgi:alanine racemase